MRHIYLGLFVLISQMALAQYSESLISDRPGQSISPNTVGKNIFQIQAGYNYDNFENKTLDGFSTVRKKTTINNNGNVKIRYGISERLEASTQTIFGQLSTTQAGADFKEIDNGIQLFGLALRGNLLNSKGGKFSLGTEFEVQFVPDGEKDLSYSDMLFTFSGALSVSKKISATANFGIHIESNTELFLTANLGYAAFENLGVFVEYYPIIENLNLVQSYMNTGLYYTVSSNFMLDLAGSFLVSDYRRDGINEIDQFIAQFGLTYRLGKSK